jgi:hypothetical protein
MESQEASVLVDIVESLKLKQFPFLKRKNVFGYFGFSACNAMIASSAHCCKNLLPAFR